MSRQQWGGEPWPVQSVMLLNRALTLDELRDLERDPWAMFRPRRSYENVGVIVWASIVAAVVLALIAWSLT